MRKLLFCPHLPPTPASQSQSPVQLIFSCKERPFVSHVGSRKAKCSVSACLPQKPLFVQSLVTLEDCPCENLSGEVNVSLICRVWRVSTSSFCQTGPPSGLNGLLHTRSLHVSHFNISLSCVFQSGPNSKQSPQGKWKIYSQAGTH